MIKKIPGQGTSWLFSIEMAEIDKSIKHDLSGIATVPVESIGVVHNLPITLAPGFTIYEDFIVVKYSKPMLILSNPLLKKYKCAID